MANTASAKKYIRSSAKKTEINNLYRDNYRKAIKDILDLLQEGKKDEALKIYPIAQKAIDKATKKGILKKNTAARKKSTLVKKLKA
jgi:small subunit ribosomal protein S20